MGVHGVGGGPLAVPHAVSLWGWSAAVPLPARAAPAARGRPAGPFAGLLAAARSIGLEGLCQLCSSVTEMLLVGQDAQQLPRVIVFLQSVIAVQSYLCLAPVVEVLRYLLLLLR